jgi:hypothetical protein
MTWGSKSWDIMLHYGMSWAFDIFAPTHEYIWYEDPSFAKLDLLITQHDDVCEPSYVILTEHAQKRRHGRKKKRDGLSIEPKMGGSLNFVISLLFFSFGSGERQHRALASLRRRRLPGFI